MKYINIKDSLVDPVSNNNNTKIKRDIDDQTTVHFTFEVKDGNNSPRNIIITQPELIKEECVPNITRTCMTLYVFCDHSLFTHFDVNQELRTSENSKNVTAFFMWPWVAKLYVDGAYKCTGVLVDLSWVLISHYCLQSYT